MNTLKLVTGAEEDVAAIEEAGAAWELSIPAQLAYIANAVKEQSEKLLAGATDFFGDGDFREPHISFCELNAIEDCVARIRKIQLDKLGE